jgi:hypothetical protein
MLAALQGQAVAATTHILMHEITEELEGHVMNTELLYQWKVALSLVH